MPKLWRRRHVLFVCHLACLQIYDVRINLARKCKCAAKLHASDLFAVVAPCTALSRHQGRRFAYLPGCLRRSRALRSGRLDIRARPPARHCHYFSVCRLSRRLRNNWSVAGVQVAAAAGSRASWARSARPLVGRHGARERACHSGPGIFQSFRVPGIEGGIAATLIRHVIWDCVNQHTDRPNNQPTSQQTNQSTTYPINKTKR